MTLVKVTATEIRLTADTACEITNLTKSEVQ